MLLPSWHGPRRARSWFRTMSRISGTCGSVRCRYWRCSPAYPLERADTLETRATDGFRFAAADGADPKGGERGFGALGGDRGGRRAVAADAGPEQERRPVLPRLARPGAFDIGREQWPYSLSSLTAVERRCNAGPRLRSILTCRRTIRRGAGRRCSSSNACRATACGWGRGRDGSDLVQPKSPTEYMTPAGLMAQIRNPNPSQSGWPSQQMPGLRRGRLSTPELGAVIAI